MKSDYHVIDVFSGIGCASLGFKNAGFKLAAALEIDDKRCLTYKKNLGISPIQGDVMNYSGKFLLKRAGLKKGGKFCMVGCPPCQSFSKLSDTTGVSTLTDPRSKYVYKFAELIEEMQPAAVVFENVPWMIEGPGKKFFDDYEKRLDKAGYRTVVDIVNANDYGVPQNRKRVVAVSVPKKVLKKRKVRLALENFHKTAIGKRKTVRDAVEDLKPLRSGQSDPEDILHGARDHGPRSLQIIKLVPKNGGSRKQIPRRYWLDCHKKLSHGAETVYGRMWWNKPSPTMTCRCITPACGRFIHPSQNRGITLREAARFQTIPDNFKFVGGRQEIESMIGDAVPVLLANKIAKKLLKLLSYA
jgi:DNA (cytosine-5)-methyltransferase 1